MSDQPHPPHTRDKVPTIVLRAQAWLYGWLSNESRILLSIVIVVLAVVAALVLASSRVLRVIFEGLDVVALIGLFLVNWLGNGGALVPIPGARFIGLLLIFQQSVILPSLEVFTAAGAAMGLGLLSYYLAGARTAMSYDEGDTAGAEELAHQTGMLDDTAVDFTPGAEFDARAVSAIAGLDAEGPAPADEPVPAQADEPVPATGMGRLRGRFSSSLRLAQERARPVIEQRGMTGIFLLCFAPTPLSTAGAFVGGLLGFSFSRYLLASFAAKYLLAGIIVVLGLTFTGAAEAVAIPEVTIPVIDVTLFDDGDPGASVQPSSAPVSPPPGVSD